MDQVLEFLFVLLLIAINGYFALAELAVLSAKKLKLQEIAKSNEKGQAVLELSEKPGRFLSSVQIGITLVGVASGAVGGATLADSLKEILQDIPFIGQYADSLSVFIVILVISYLSLVFGELVPKQIALSNPERYAVAVGPVMHRFALWFAPAIKLFSASSNLVTRLLGIDTSRQPEVSVEELRLMIDEGSISGIIEPNEEIMLEQVLRFNEARIEAIVTPRTDILWIDIHATPAEIKDILISVRHDKLPVAEDDIDNVLGMVYTNDLLAQLLESGEIDLRAALNPAVFVSESMDLLEALELMRRKHSDMIFVLNEFGGVDGMVTTKDILEVIVGDLPEADESFDPKIVRREDGSYLLDGALLLDNFLELFDIDFEGNVKRQAQTLAGFIITQLGEIPSTGDKFQMYGYEFEIVDMDKNRIDKILVYKK